MKLGSAHLYVFGKPMVSMRREYDAMIADARARIASAHVVTILSHASAQLSIPGPVLRDPAPDYLRKGGASVTYEGFIEVTSGKHIRIITVCRNFYGYGARLSTIDCSGRQ
jgi:hypothetical protein